MSDSDHHHYFQMVQGGVACACGETVTATPGAEKVLPQLLEAVDMAMKMEGVPDPGRQRVMNRLIYGDPEGPRAVRRTYAGQEVHVQVTPPSGTGIDAIVTEIRDQMIRAGRDYLNLIQPRRGQ